MAEEILEYEQINWGWLNDYAGYKFAPITFLDNLFTKDGEVFQSIYDKNLDDLKSGDFVVGAAEKLGTLNDEIFEPYNSSSNKPIYFKDGIPTQNEILNIDLIGNINNVENYKDFTIKAGNIISENITGTNINGTDITGTNITGTNIIGTSITSSSGEPINGDIKFNKPIKLEFINQVTGSAEINQSGETVQISMALNSPGGSVGEYGPNLSSTKTLAHEGTFQVPFFTTDDTGRISSAKTVSYKLPAGNKINFAADTTTETSYVLTYPGSGQTLKYHTGVYVDHKTGVLMGAAWNDYAEYRNQVENIEPGYCVASTNQGKVYKTTEKFQACDGIVSDTYGFTIGKTDECQTPLAVSGRVLAYYNGDIKDYNSGDTVCAGPNGKVCKMTREEIREYPDRIVGIISEIPEYEEWNGTKVNNRIWIKIK